MATIAPPPSKRQRREDAERARVQQDVATTLAGPAGSFKARFLDGDGTQVCDVIEVPLADASEKNLSLLLNTLLGKVCRCTFIIAVYQILPWTNDNKLMLYWSIGGRWAIARLRRLTGEYIGTRRISPLQVPNSHP